MTKAKAKSSSSSSGVAPPRPRSLRSGRRERPSDDMSEIDDVQAAHHQDTEGNHTTVDATLSQSLHPPLQEQDETNVTDPSTDSQLKGFKAHAGTDANDSGKDEEEMTAEECDASASQTSTDQLQVCVQISEEAAAALEGQPAAEENPECHFEKNQEVSREEPGNVTDVKETAQEAAAGPPAKKKRRMGVCGLTERERSHFLHTRKRENGQNGAERGGKQSCSNTADPVAQEEITSSSSSSLSVPGDNVTGREKVQCSHCGGEDRAETEVHIAATTSHGTSVVSEPGGSEGTRSEVEAGVGPGPEQRGDTKSDLPAEEEEEELLGNQVQQEHEGATAEKPQEQVNDGGDGSAAVDQSPAITLSSHTAQSEETEDRDAIEAAPPQASGETRTGEEELTGDAADDDGAEASSTRTTQAGGVSAVQLCEAAVTPGGSEDKDSCDSDGEPGAGPPTVNAEPPQTRDAADPFGSGSLDYVSDSQLNTIVLTEEVVMEEEHEDATDLICGLITELSSLNRKVMTSHRELENLRRSSKSSRGCKR
ncbi:break repair meiotic recombinase recruitment factor 1-like isoform X2 [Cebidichthys violaceus]|uniref:break repair meiotic recombinase recruitment factor 1-like isoform X2 n=1 Tax=Cebidichthys violaceus TaxID=271503 RepID=UPI0035C95902